MVDFDIEVWVAKPHEMYNGELSNCICLYEEKVYSSDKIFLGFSLIVDSQDIEKSPFIHDLPPNPSFPGFSKKQPIYTGQVLLKNARYFISNIKQFVKVGNGRYSFEPPSADEYKFYDEDSKVGICAVCEEEVKASDSFLSIPNFTPSMSQKITQKMIHPFHEKCLDSFAEKLEKELSNTDYVSEVI